MASELEQYRKYLKDAVKLNAGMGKGQQTGTPAQNRTIYSQAEIMGLPIDLDSYMPLQVLDYGADFGKFYFMPGFSQVGGGDIIR